MGKIMIQEVTSKKSSFDATENGELETIEERARKLMKKRNSAGDNDVVCAFLQPVFAQLPSPELRANTNNKTVDATTEKRGHSTLASGDHRYKTTLAKDVAISQPRVEARSGQQRTESILSSSAAKDLAVMLPDTTGLLSEISKTDAEPKSDMASRSEHRSGGGEKKMAERGIINPTAIGEKALIKSTAISQIRADTHINQLNSSASDEWVKSERLTHDVRQELTTSPWITMHKEDTSLENNAATKQYRTVADIPLQSNTVETSTVAKSEMTWYFKSWGSNGKHSAKLVFTAPDTSVEMVNVVPSDEIVRNVLISQQNRDSLQNVTINNPYTHDSHSEEHSQRDQCSDDEDKE